MRAREIYEYNKLTWPEMNDAIEMQKVVILPTGSTEQHGPHMPLDVDLFLVREVCHELGRRAPDQVLIRPAIPCGLNLHHIDFPGTIHISRIISSTTAWM
jgi:creatinine amidohydrolase